MEMTVCLVGGTILTSESSLCCCGLLTVGFRGRCQIHPARRVRGSGSLGNEYVNRFPEPVYESHNSLSTSWGAKRIGSWEKVKAVLLLLKNVSQCGEILACGIARDPVIAK